MIVKSIYNDIAVEGKEKHRPCVKTNHGEAK